MSDGPQASTDTVPRFEVRIQYIKDLSFEVPRAPEIFTAEPKPPQVQVDVDVNARPLAAPGDHEVTLSLRVEAQTADGPLFILELVYGALFHLVGIPEEHREQILMVECPRLLFPFARSIVADATRDSGFPSLLIQPIDFLALYQQRSAAGQA